MKALAVSLLIFTVPVQDTVELTSGKKLEGRVVYEDDEVLVLRRGTRDREFDIEDVVAVDSERRNLDRFLRLARGGTSNDLKKNLALATRAYEMGLESEARLFWWRVLDVAPGHEVANTRLGHVKRGSRWFVPDGGRKLPFDKLRERRKNWGDAWEFETTHYVVRTNLDLTLALDAALELECFYFTFFSAFGRHLKLYEVEEPMRVHLHADASSYPETGNEWGYFAPSDNVVHFDASRGLPVGPLIHEATHQLIHNTAVRERVYSGSIPGWLDEGLAEYMGASIIGNLGGTKVSVGEVARGHLARHGSAKKPYKLSRVINFNSGDFQGSTGRSLKYAQAYSLVHFCLHGEDGRYRNGFLDFVRGCYQGKSSSTHFKKAVGIGKEKEFDKVWLEYARAGGRQR